MLKVWAGLEARSFLQASAESVSSPVTSVIEGVLTRHAGRELRATRSPIAEHINGLPYLREGGNLPMTVQLHTSDTACGDSIELYPEFGPLSR